MHLLWKDNFMRWNFSQYDNLKGTLISYLLHIFCAFSTFSRSFSDNLSSSFDAFPTFFHIFPANFRLPVFCLRQSNSVVLINKVSIYYRSLPSILLILILIIKTTIVLKHTISEFRASVKNKKYRFSFLPKASVIIFDLNNFSCFSIILVEFVLTHRCLHVYNDDLHHWQAERALLKFYSTFTLNSLIFYKRMNGLITDTCAASLFISSIRKNFI